MSSIIFVLSCFIRAQTAAPDCEVAKRQIGEAISRASAASPAEQFRAYLKFFETIPDSPVDCIGRDMRAAIAASEAKLVRLEISGKPMEPWNVLHCDKIDPRTHRCISYETDDSLIMSEAGLLRSVPSMGGQPKSSVTLNRDYDTRVIDVPGGSAKAMRNGRSPTGLPHRGAVIELAPLKRYADPVLIVILKRDDTLHYRKMVWFLKR